MAINKIRFNAIDNNTAEIYLYGYIGFDITANDFANELKSLTKDFANIIIRINSGGGSVFEGIAIYNLIKNSRSIINIYIDGIAASMGSVIAMSGRKIYMSKYARIMMHCPSGSADGDSKSLRETADRLDSIEKDLTDIYAQRTGLPADQAKSKFMQPGVNKWLSAQEALKEKLIDEIYDGPVVTIPATETTNLSAKEMFEFYNKIDINQKNETQMKQLAKFVAFFAMANINLPVDASEELVLNSVEKVIKDRQDLLKKLSDAEEKIKAFENKAKLENENKIKNLVENAVAEGKITADLKDSYTHLATANYDATEKALNAIKPYTPVNSQLKTAEGNEDPKAKWSFKDWQKNDPTGLSALKNSDFEKFKSLYKLEYGVDYK